MDKITSDYHDHAFNEAQVKEAFRLYKKWCKDNGFTPEISCLNEINETNISHVVYHAELIGFTY